jgi:hypothetical protein
MALPLHGTLTGGLLEHPVIIRGSLRWWWASSPLCCLLRRHRGDYNLTTGLVAQPYAIAQPCHDYQ